jgi:succinyl-CoA:acetate CoA-transferase
MLTRIEDAALRERIVDAGTAASFLCDGMTLGIGGTAACGYPKSVANALTERVRQGDKLALTVMAGANLGPEIDLAWTESKILKRRLPLQMTPACARQINSGEIAYPEMPLCRFPSLLNQGVLGDIDVAIVEALRIKKGGEIVLTNAVGAAPALLKRARHIIVEINTAQSDVFEGTHDIYLPEYRTGMAIPITDPAQRIGSSTITVDIEKIKYIVWSDIADVEISYAPPDSNSIVISENLLNFLELELSRQKISRLPPVQTGIGNMANHAARTLGMSNFKDIDFFCGVLQEANIELMASGKARALSTSAVVVNRRVRELLEADPKRTREHLVLRPMEVTNCPIPVSQMQIVALNSAIEIDIYGNLNLSHLMGNRVVNGIGGADAFAQNAFLSIVLASSAVKNDDISTFVPKVTHQDISAHNIDVIITEQGVADLRGKTPTERAQSIINNCASPIYKEALGDYFKRSVERSAGHQPVLLDECFSWHLRYQETGSMKQQNY